METVKNSAAMSHGVSAPVPSHNLNSETYMKSKMHLSGYSLNPLEYWCLFVSSHRDMLLCTVCCPYTKGSTFCFSSH